MHEIIQIITAFTGVIGYCIIFNIHGKKLWISSIGGAVCWIVYLLILNFDNADKVAACFLSSMVMAGVAEIFSRIFKTPVTIFLMPMILPLIPGSDLYYMMINIVEKNFKAGGNIGFLLLEEAGAIALGIIVMTSIVQVIGKIFASLLKKKC